EQYEFLYHAVTEMFHRELQKPHQQQYENLREGKVSLYDDARSLLTPGRILSQRENCSRASLAPDFPPQSPTEQSARDMNDTYAVVRKHRLTAPGAPSVPQTPPCAPDTRCQPPSNHQYDNLTSRTAPPVSLDQLYSTVTPRYSRVISPANVPSSSSISSSSYALAGTPGSPEIPPAEYASVPRTVDTNSTCPASPNSAGSKGNGKWRQLPQSVLPASPDRKGLCQDDYEDVTDPSKGQLPAVSTCSGLGFNYRVGKPKGPRDRPAEWSHIER
ncbi:tyrosine-protein phosphatase non-receptor type 18-like, partial [Ascaphus truei]|uniref:tyrosine-protein phosphatase non-receptor type 18-like n=1 Tax=Ascaphus truei TaxID=8439 RepID=UPI003F5A0E52